MFPRLFYSTFLLTNISDPVIFVLRQVTKEEAQKYAEEEGLMWGETSAKSGAGVAEIFTSIGSYASH